MSNYAIDDSDGNLLSCGYQDEDRARAAAQRFANESGENVLVYEEGPEGWSEVIKPVVVEATMKPRTVRYNEAWRDPRHGEVRARCSSLDLGDGNLGEVIAIAIVDLGDEASVDDIEAEVRGALAQ